MVVISRSYLDFNATAPARPEVIDAVVDAMGERGNASSVHADGRSARSRVENARAQVASLVGAEVNNVVFTGSGTESNNQALRAADCERIIVSAIEHESVLQARADADPFCLDVMSQNVRASWPCVDRRDREMWMSFTQCCPTRFAAGVPPNHYNYTYQKLTLELY